MSSIPHALLGDFVTAKDTISKAKPYLKDYIREQAIYHETLGWIYNLEGDYTAGLTELTKGLTIAEDIAPESALMSQIKRRIADSYLGLNEYKLAELLATEALAVAQKLNERVEIAECRRIRAQLACHDGDHDTAREHFRNAIDMFNMIGTRYNLAVCRYIAATSGLYRDGERNALLYLAREYFASEDVAHYVKKIDAEFNRGSFRVTPAPASGNDEHSFIAVSPKTQKIVETAGMLAPSSISVLLTGDTGTGKDLLARHIHDRSGCEGPFVTVNIAAIPETMLEAELLGYRKGAFTGAETNRTGLIEEADKGTFFLNEVSAAPAAIQVKLLDALERRTIRRLGENTERSVAFRLLSASNRDLEEMIRQNEFRADLYHRIKQEEIKLPPLRERTGDIPELIRHFLMINGMASDDHQAEAVASQYATHQWPGNVRELKLEIQRLAMMANKDFTQLLELIHLERDTIDDAEREELVSLLIKHGWNRSKVAEALNVSEGAIRYRMKKYEIAPL